MRQIDENTRYYRQRCLEERERAAQATSREAQAAHRHLAALYQQRFNRSDSDPSN